MKSTGLLVPDIGADIGHFRHANEIIGESVGRRLGSLQGGSFGHIDHHLELIPIVKREHFKRHPVRKHQPAGKSKEQDHKPQDAPSEAPRIKQRRHNSVIELK